MLGMDRNGIWLSGEFLMKSQASAAGYGSAMQLCGIFYSPSHVIAREQTGYVESTKTCKGSQAR